eukprot:1134237-Pelagomonas_calceolata.AAC.2
MVQACGLQTWWREKVSGGEYVSLKWKKEESVQPPSKCKHAGCRPVAENNLGGDDYLSSLEEGGGCALLCSRCKHEGCKPGREKN